MRTADRHWLEAHLVGKLFGQPGTEGIDPRSSEFGTRVGFPVEVNRRCLGGCLFVSRNDKHRP